jgi:hypothetical protein
MQFSPRRHGEKHKDVAADKRRWALIRTKFMHQHTWLTLLSTSVISADHERAKRLSASGEIPRVYRATRLIHGVSTRTLSSKDQCHLSVAPAAWGERLVWAWRRTHRRDFSTRPSVACAPSFSARNDRFEMWVSSILMPKFIPAGWFRSAFICVNLRQIRLGLRVSVVEVQG